MSYTLTDPFSLLLLNLIDRIATIQDIPYVTKDMGQLETREQPDIDGKATALISFQNFMATDMGELSQELLGDVVVKLAVPAYSMVTNITPDAAKEAALNFTTLGHELYLTLHGWGVGEPFGRLTRVAVTEDLRRPGLPVWVMRFRLGGDDHSAKVTKTKRPAGLKVTAETS